MLLCRVIHPLGVQVLRVLSLVTGALLDYGWVIFGHRSMCALFRGAIGIRRFGGDCGHKTYR